MARQQWPIAGMENAGFEGFVVPGIAAAAFGLLAHTDAALAAAARTVTPIYVFGIPVDFILFGLTLLGVALFPH